MPVLEEGDLQGKIDQEIVNSVVKGVFHKISSFPLTKDEVRECVGNSLKAYESKDEVLRFSILQGLYTGLCENYPDSPTAMVQQSMKAAILDVVDRLEPFIGSERFAEISKMLVLVESDFSNDNRAYTSFQNRRGNSSSIYFGRVTMEDYLNAQNNLGAFTTPVALPNPGVGVVGRIGNQQLEGDSGVKQRKPSFS